MVSGESRSQGSQNWICAWRQDEESATEHQGSQNEPPLGTKMASRCMLRLTLPCAQVAQECSPSAQVKAAAAHVQTLKRNQRKKKSSLTYVAATVLLSAVEPIVAITRASGYPENP